MTGNFEFYWACLVRFDSFCFALAMNVLCELYLLLWHNGLHLLIDWIYFLNFWVHHSINLNKTKRIKVATKRILFIENFQTNFDHMDKCYVKTESKFGISKHYDWTFLIGERAFCCNQDPIIDMKSFCVVKEKWSLIERYDTF